MLPSLNSTILLAEDDENDAFLMRRAFARVCPTLKLEEVRDGDQVIEYLLGRGLYARRDQYPWPSVLLLDLKMPRKSGFDVLKWLRDETLLSRLIVVVLTSSTQESDINRAYDLGANSYLVKPAKFDMLEDMVRRLVGYWLAMNEGPRIAETGRRTALKSAASQEELAAISSTPNSSIRPQGFGNSVTQPERWP